MTGRLLSNTDSDKGIKGIVALVPNVFHPDNVPEEHRSDYKSFTENATDVPNLDAGTLSLFPCQSGASLA